jgi:hypothetical protein
MSLTVKKTGASTPRFSWTAQHMRAFAEKVVAHLVVRTFDRGIGDAGVEHRRYSTRAFKVYSRSQTARRLGGVGAIDGGAGLRGGVPFAWVRGPRQPGGGYDRTRIGETAGKIYPGGYRAFKLANRRGLTSSTGRGGVEVDLVLSGQMMRSIGVLRTTRLDAVVGMRGEARTYGPHVDAARPFMGLSSGDRAELHEVLAEVAAMALGGRRG